ncbi:MAG: hypothetical protein FWC92_06240 [Defluviitaleaceae bacterium]|nr:hypothetical protein [Defluviitaleaceae bacterium]
MNRTPYRRVTPSRRNTGEYPREREYEDDTVSTNVSGVETLIMQCILCGIIMVFVLIASMTDIAPASTLRNGIRQVLTGAETLDELIADVRQLSENWLASQPSETSITSDEYYIPTSLPYETTDFDLEQTSFPSIDNEGTYTDPYPPAADDQVSNPTVPEPPVTPGLWD